MEQRQNNNHVYEDYDSSFPGTLETRISSYGMP